MAPHRHHHRGSSHYNSAVSAKTIHSLPTRVLRPLLIHNYLKQLVAKNAEPLGDRRRFNPTNITRPTTRSATPARLNNNRLRTIYSYPFEIAVPHKVRICERRKTRREVLHALKRTGKGSGAKRRYTNQSDYHC